MCRTHRDADPESCGSGRHTRRLGLYLFEFTYLYVGIVNLADLEPEGLGWFSLFVCGAAVV